MWAEDFINWLEDLYDLSTTPFTEEELYEQLDIWLGINYTDISDYSREKLIKEAEEYLLEKYEHRWKKL